MKLNQRKLHQYNMVFDSSRSLQKTVEIPLPVAEFHEVPPQCMKKNNIISYKIHPRSTFLRSFCDGVKIN